MYRLIIEHIVRKLALEARSQSATRKVRDAIVASDTSHIKSAQAANRIFAPDLSTEDIINKIKKLYSAEVRVIEPKQEGSESSKFPTLEFDVDGNTVKIVHAKGIVAGAEGEEKQVSSIQNQLQGKSITLRIGKETYNDVDGFKKIIGNKKADFAFTSKGKDVAFIQHKSLTHQQISGIKKFKKEDGTYVYPEMNELVQQVRTNVKANGRLASKVVVPITSKGLEELAVYGNPQDKGTPNFVEAYCVGDMQLKEVGNNTYELTAPEMYVYPAVPKDKPILMATYRKGRTQDGIQDVRFGIYPGSYGK